MLHPAHQVVFVDAVLSSGSHEELAGEDAAAERARADHAPLLILDTDLVSTAVYSRHYYGACPDWIPPAARARRGDLYLLHHVDVEWVADGHQREQPQRRTELFALFRETLRELGASVADIEGGWDERRRRAIRAVDPLVAGSGGRKRDRNG